MWEINYGSPICVMDPQNSLHCNTPQIQSLENLIDEFTVSKNIYRTLMDTN